MLFGRHKHSYWLQRRHHTEVPHTASIIPTDTGLHTRLLYVAAQSLKERREASSGQDVKRNSHRWKIRGKDFEQRESYPGSEKMPSYVYKIVKVRYIGLSHPRPTNPHCASRCSSVSRSRRYRRVISLVLKDQSRQPRPRYEHLRAQNSPDNTIRPLVQYLQPEAKDSLKLQLVNKR